MTAAPFRMANKCSGLDAHQQLDEGNVIEVQNWTLVFSHDICKAVDGSPTEAHVSSQMRILDSNSYVGV